jgi:hypothetical protein
MSPKCLEAMGGTPPEFPFYLTDVKVNRSQPTSSRSVTQQHTSYTEQQPVAQQVYTHQEVYNPSASANMQPKQIAPQAQAVRFIFFLRSARPLLIPSILMPPFVFIILAACSRRTTCWMGRLAGPFKWKYILRQSDYRRGDLGDASGRSSTSTCAGSAACRPTATRTATRFRGCRH